MSYQQMSLITVFGMVGIGVIGLILFMAVSHYQNKQDDKKREMDSYWKQRRKELFPYSQEKKS
jgi:mannose/fructose/N-acetylgalactosamine-specific phosphotransferase system component IIC